jgi:hypothetical protein
MPGPTPPRRPFVQPPIDLHERIIKIETDVSELKTWKGEVEATENRREDELRHVTKGLVDGARAALEHITTRAVDEIKQQVAPITALAKENKEQTALLGDLRTLARAANDERIERSTREKVIAEQEAFAEKKRRDEQTLIEAHNASKKLDAEINVMVADPKVKRLQIVLLFLTPVVAAVVAALLSYCNQSGH